MTLYVNCTTPLLCHQVVKFLFPAIHLLVLLPEIEHRHTHLLQASSKSVAFHFALRVTPLWKVAFGLAWVPVYGQVVTVVIN